MLSRSSYAGRKRRLFTLRRRSRLRQQFSEWARTMPIAPLKAVVNRSIDACLTGHSCALVCAVSLRKANSAYIQYTYDDT